MHKKLGRPSPATVIACMALFFAVAGGSAIALSGKNTVDSGDIKKGQVKTSDLANNAVTTKKIKANGVRSGDIRNGQVRTLDIAPAQNIRLIGAAGQPQLGTGGEGDCLWSLSDPAFPIPFRFGPAGFFKDALGYVRMSGILFPVDGPGGDGNCGGGDPGEMSEDSVAFILPQGYRPTNDVFAGGGGPSVAIVIGTTPLTSGADSWPAGAVASGFSPGSPILLNGISFEPAGLPGGAARRDTSSRRAAADGGDWQAALAELFG